MDCPWTGIKQQSTNFTNILDEEISKGLQLKKCNQQGKTYSRENEKVLLNSSEGNDDGNVQNDEIIAQLLQMEYDNEHMLKKTEAQINGISFSFNNYRTVPVYNESESDEEDQETADFADVDNENSFDELLRGYKYQDTKVKSSTGPKKKINNKLLSNEKQSYSPTVDTKLNQAMIDVCKQFITVLFDKMVHTVSLISVGKYAIIFHAYTKPSFPHSLPKECLVKVYKSTLFEYIQLNKNIKDDHCLKNVNRFAKKNSIQIIAEKERATLMKFQKFEVKCPRVITLKSGVLIITFIGKNGKSEPTLHNAVMTSDDYHTAFFQIIEFLRRMYENNIIYGELSEHNILWHNKQCYIVGIGRCLEPTNKAAFDALYGDCGNLTRFFKGKFYSTSWWRPIHSLQRITSLLGWLDKHTLQEFRQAYELKHKV